MNILHICNDFAYSKVHKNLYKEFDNMGFTQIIFHPLRVIDNMGKNDISFSVRDSRIIYSNLLTSVHKLIFERKIKFLFREIVEKVNVSAVDFTMATTLFSDGFLAYKLLKQYGIPYSVAIRSSDVQVFFKYRPDLIPLGLKIIRNARKVIFVSGSIEKSIETNFFFKCFIDKNILKNAITICNGVDDFWINNRFQDIIYKRNSTMIYVGTFEKRKNVNRLLDALENVRLQHPDIKLMIVGGNKDEDNVVERIAKLNWVDFKGQIKDPILLKDSFRQCGFFVMPSFRETFGLVYIEAITQGLPVLYSKKQGIDGVFQEAVGVKVEPHNLDSIIEGLNILLDRGSEFQNKIRNIDMERFRWGNIAKVYLEEVFN